MARGYSNDRDDEEMGHESVAGVRILIRRLMDKMKVFLEMIKFEHSIFALPFAYLGLFLAEEGWPKFSLLMGVTVAMVSFRSMAMGLNRLIDVEIDSLNPRTRNRALPRKELKPSFVILMVFLSFLIFELSAFLLNKVCFFLSPIPVVLAFLYSYTKRWTWGSHFILGLILAMAPSGAWLASRGDLSWTPIFLSVGVLTWVAGFDIIYALQDVEFDRKYGFFSIPACFSGQKGMQWAGFLHLATLLAWSFAGYFAGMGIPFALGMAFVGGLLLREILVVRSSEIRKIQDTFFVTNAIVSISVLCATVIDFFLRRFVG